MKPRLVSCPPASLHFLARIVLMWLTALFMGRRLLPGCHGLQTALFQGGLRQRLFGFHHLHHHHNHHAFRQRQRPAPSLVATRWNSSSSSSTEQQRKEEPTAEEEKTINSEWNMKGLRKEVSRLILRCHKKISKSSAPEQLENWRQRLGDLRKFEDSLSTLPGKTTVVLPPALAQAALDLQVNDAPPGRPVRGPKRKKKGPRQQAGRLPYRSFYSETGVEIRVGKTATDNDALSTNRTYDQYWWMHAAGCPGSHVIVCTTADDGEIMQDAAVLAAWYSKGKNQKICGVNVVRSRDVSKPAGAKPGLVQIKSGAGLRTIQVQLHRADAAERLERLQKSLDDGTTV